MNIHIILPKKEFFLENSPGAVSIMVNDQLKFSKFKKKIKVYGSVGKIKQKPNFFNIIKNSFFFKNKNYIKNFSKFNIQKNSIIEIHNRPYYFIYLKKKFPKCKFILFFHNNPLEYKSSKSITERKFILENCDHICFLSKFIKNKFFSNLKTRKKNYSIVYPGCVKLKKIPIKKNYIIFIGKLNHSKGYDIYSEFSNLFSAAYKQWKILSVGNESRRIIPKNSNINELGSLKHSDVLNLLKISKISVANSRSQEALGRLPIESAANACVPISSNKGGLKESNPHGVILKNNNAKSLFLACKKIIKNYDKFQKKVFNNYKFDSAYVNKKIDLIREKI